MNYNVILIRTEAGGRYARKILNSVKWLQEHKYPKHKFNTVDLTIEQFMNDWERLAKDFNPANTIIHARCANPRTKWTIKLRKLQEAGFKVVNSVDAIELTSNKLACSLHLQNKVAHPKTWEYIRGMNEMDFVNLLQDIDAELDSPEEFIAKPLTSLEQGANVQKVKWPIMATRIELRQQIDLVPGDKIVIQELIPYTALHRVIVIGGVALPYTFIDRVEWHKNENDWKVSCCLNRTTMQLNEFVPPRLIQLAEETQKAVGGSINFIDIFEFPWKDNEDKPRDGGGNYTNAEINTACSLNIHEDLAKKAGRKDWNIHYRIAKELLKQLGV